MPLSAIISNLATENWVTSNFVAKEAGKGLSTNDYDDDEKEKVAQLQFSESRKKTEPKGSEMTFAPQGRNLSSKHGIMWARRERTHMIQSLAEGAAPTTPN